MVPYEAMGTAWLYTRDDDLLCEGVYQEASMPNSPLCTVQGKWEIRLRVFLAVARACRVGIERAKILEKRS